MTMAMATGMGNRGGCGCIDFFSIGKGSRGAETKTTINVHHSTQKKNGTKTPSTKILLHYLRRHSSSRHHAWLGNGTKKTPTRLPTKENAKQQGYRGTCVAATSREAPLSLRLRCLIYRLPIPLYYTQRARPQQTLPPHRLPYFLGKYCRDAEKKHGELCAGVPPRQKGGQGPDRPLEKRASE